MAENLWMNIMRLPDMCFCMIYASLSIEASSLKGPHNYFSYYEVAIDLDFQFVIIKKRLMCEINGLNIYFVITMAINIACFYSSRTRGAASPVPRWTCSSTTCTPQPPMWGARPTWPPPPWPGMGLACLSLVCTPG